MDGKYKQAVKNMADILTKKRQGTDAHTHTHTHKNHYDVLTAMPSSGIKTTAHSLHLFQAPKESFFNLNQRRLSPLPPAHACKRVRHK